MDGTIAFAMTAPRASVTPRLTAFQHTIAKSVSCEGTGVHSGEKARLELRPAAAGNGIRFIRTDKPFEVSLIPALWNKVCDTRLCTALANEYGTTLATVEHLLAALSGAGVDNVDVLVDGPEVPIMDGSSEAFSALIAEAGLETQLLPRRFIRILKPVRVEENGKWASLAPAETQDFEMTIEFDSAAIGRQTRAFTLMNGAFVHDLARARTFATLPEVQQMQKLGLAKGGSLENAIVVDGDKVLNPDGLRHADEFVRHKLLDSVGDLALAGGPILGLYRSEKGGHALNNRLLHAVFADSANWEWTE